MWTLKAYIHRPGTDVLDEWYDSHPYGKKWRPLWTRFYTVWHYLRQQPINAWLVANPWYHALKGREGIGRIGYDVKNIAYRHLGFFGPYSNEFTLLVMAEEHDDVYLPRGCEVDAVNRMNLIKTRPELARHAKPKVPPENV